jgi:hypothetical protein
MSNPLVWCALLLDQKYDVRHILGEEITQLTMQRHFPLPEGHDE